jgi:hypothetical protein
MALKETIRELIWLKSLFYQINTDKGLKFPTMIHTDSQSAIELAKDPTYHARTKHIDIHYHFVRDQTRNGNVELQYIPTGDQLADAFTKALAPPKLKTWLQKINFQSQTD